MNDTKPPVQLQKLSPVHKQVLQMVAQGIDRQTIAAACNIVPEYVSWLVKQDVCKEYLQEMRDIVDTQLEMMTTDSVSAIREVLQTGCPADRVRAAKLQMEAVGRIGSRAPTGASASSSAEVRLEQLAARLTGLLTQARASTMPPIDGTFTVVPQTQGDTQ